MPTSDASHSPGPLLCRVSPLFASTGPAPEQPLGSWLVLQAEALPRPSQCPLPFSEGTLVFTSSNSVLWALAEGLLKGPFPHPRSWAFVGAHTRGLFLQAFADQNPTLPPPACLTAHPAGLAPLLKALPPSPHPTWVLSAREGLTPQHLAQHTPQLPSGPIFFCPVYTLRPTLIRPPQWALDALVNAQSLDIEARSGQVLRAALAALANASGLPPSLLSPRLQLVSFESSALEAAKSLGIKCALVSGRLTKPTADSN